VAGLGGYDPEILGIDKFLELLPEIFLKAGWPQERQDAVFGRIESFVSCLPEDEPGAWLVESVAALPEVRRRGVTTALLEHTLAAARERGYRQAQISVLIGNTPAQKAYEKVGFTAADEKTSPEFQATYGSPGIRRLLMTL
jgi:ribosomal protein S18 acetylase RimI-like enzyme